MKVHMDFLCSYFENVHSLNRLRLCYLFLNKNFLQLAKNFLKSRDLWNFARLLPDPHDKNITERSYDRAIYDHFIMESKSETRGWNRHWLRLKLIHNLSVYW